MTGMIVTTDTIAMTGTIDMIGIGHPTVRHIALGTIIIVRVTVGNPITITTIATGNRLFSKPSCLVQIQLGGFFLLIRNPTPPPPPRGGGTKYPPSLLGEGAGGGGWFFFYNT